MAMAKVGAAPFEVTVQFNPFTTFRRPRESLFAQTAEEDEAAERVRIVRARTTTWYAGDPGRTDRQQPTWTAGLTSESHQYVRDEEFTAAASWTLKNGHPAMRVNVNLGARDWRMTENGEGQYRYNSVYVRFAYIAAKHLREGKLTLLFETDVYDKPYAELPFVLTKESVTPALIGLDDFLGRVGFAGVMT